MVQAADFAELQDVPRRWQLDRSGIGRVPVEREVGARLMVVAEVMGQDAAEMPLAEDGHMIQALAPDRADEPLRERVLPRALRRRENFVDAQALYAMTELLTVDSVAIPEEIGRGGLVREGVHDLLAGPGGSRMLGDVEVDNARRW
jgi:hypothetical protein